MADGISSHGEDAVDELLVPVVVRHVQAYPVSRFDTRCSAPIQALAPMQRSVVGATSLNIMLQEAINGRSSESRQACLNGRVVTDEGEANPAGDSLARGGFKYRQGDRVMQIRNNYDKDVFNGDIGTVSAIDTEDRSLTVLFDGRTVSYEDSELYELTLAYAIHNQTVQKRNTRLKERLHQS